MDRTWGRGGSAKTRLAPQTNGDAMTSTWLGKSRELCETLAGGRLHCANVSSTGSRPSLNKTIHEDLAERKGIKILFPGKYLIYALILHPKRTQPSAALPELCLLGY